jgi:glycosyltransferase involved in cell wall biosynthesis
MTTTIDYKKVSIVLPAKNEGESLKVLLPKLRDIFPHTEILVVNDGSTDDTLAHCEASGVRVVTHPYPKGNGAAIKSGARAATGDILVFMDADGQHQPEDISQLLDKMAHGYDMVVGARTRNSQAGLHRATANGIYNRLASWMVGHTIADLTSGFRVVKTHIFREYLHLLPNGFSYPTTTTMCFFRAGRSVAYLPIHAPKRLGKSHVRLIKDGMRFFLIIFKIGTLYSPLKLFAPVSAFFFLSGIGYYLYTFLTIHRFTNMSALLFISAVMVFLIGLISEQITSLMFRDTENK